ncbi:MAG: hypothetical protein ABWW69_06460 [Pyrodictiaceae archaeon]
MYGVLKLFDKILLKTFYGIERFTKRLTELIEEPIYRVRSMILDKLSLIESHNLVNMIAKYERGDVEAEYTSPDILLEKLKEEGFREAYSSDIGVGYEVVLVNMELGRRVSITWKCKTAFTCTLLLSWDSLSPSV